MDLSYKNIWKITYPIFISLLLQQIVGITDVIFLGKLGEIALSGSALASTYFLIIFMVAIGFSTGSQIIMARRNGEENYQKIGPIYYQATSCLFIVSLIIILTSFFITPLILESIISSSEILDATISYINWRFWGFIPLFIVIMTRSFYIAITKTKILSLASFCTVSFNVLFNYCFIFGNLGFPKMGIAGAALGSVLAECVSLLILLIYTYLKVDFIKYGLNKFIYKNIAIIKEILDLSVWTMLQQFISIGSWFLFFLAIEHLGSTSLAISNIIRSISAIPYMVINSLAITTGTLVSNLIGSEEDNRVIYCCNKLIKISATLTLPLLIIFIIFRDNILTLYTTDTNLIEYSKLTYLVMLGANILGIPAFILFSAISGTGQTKKAMQYEFIATVFYLIHVIWVIFYLKADIAWCWSVDYTYNLLILVFSAYYMYKNKWCCKII